MAADENFHSHCSDTPSIIYYKREQHSTVVLIIDLQGTTLYYKLIPITEHLSGGYVEVLNWLHFRTKGPTTYILVS